MVISLYPYWPERPFSESSFLLGNSGLFLLPLQIKKKSLYGYKKSKKKKMEDLFLEKISKGDVGIFKVLLER